MAKKNEDNQYQSNAADRDAASMGDTGTGEAVGTVGGGVAGAVVGSAFGPIGTVVGGIAGAAMGNKAGEEVTDSDDSASK